MTIIDGKQLAQDILDHVKSDVADSKTKPKLAIVYVGDDKPSKTYIKRKREAAEYAGIDFELHEYANDVTEKKLIAEIKKIQKSDDVTGIIVQLPLPAHLNSATIINTIDPDKDVDCMTDINIGKLVMETNHLTPPTPQAVLAILESIDTDVRGKNITIVGAGPLVGKPLTIMLLNKQATVTVCNIYTKNLKKKCKRADILITAVGKKDLIRGTMVKRGAIVIDTGIAFENKKMYGDANFKEVSKRAAYITPTPGGVGPITVSLLLKNTLKCTK